MENRKPYQHTIASPYLIHFSKIGDPFTGYISVAENASLPFKIERLYWTYLTPESVTRGAHAHYNLEQIIIAVAGEITITIENIQGKKETFHLSMPHIGLFIPKMCWREIKYSHNAVQLVLASMQYSENDYIRDYDAFRNIKKTI
jgi:hypothetical protein